MDSTDLRKTGIDEKTIRVAELLKSHGPEKTAQTSSEQTPEEATKAYSLKLRPLTKAAETLILAGHKANQTDLDIIITAAAIKITDNRDNSDIRRLPEDKQQTPKTLARNAAYSASIAILQKLLVKLLPLHIPFDQRHRIDA